MTDLYARLKVIGFPSSYIRARILPDWWEDELANDPGNRRLAELAIARTLKIPLTALVERAAPLSLEDAKRRVRFKAWKDVKEDRLLPAVALASRICELVLSCAKNLPAFRLEGYPASSLRERVLSQHQCVTLSTLLQYAWDFGVPVVHLGSLPDGSKKVDGMAFCLGDRPCIALASAKSSPAWFTWHLAHEMGHVGSGHLRTGDSLDISIDFKSKKAEEREANTYALDVVYGADHRSGFSSKRHIKGETLAREARSVGRLHRIAPGCIVTSYGFNMDAWGTVNRALSFLGISEGGPEKIRHVLAQRLDLDVLSDTDRHFLVKVTGIQE